VKSLFGRRGWWLNLSEALMKRQTRIIRRDQVGNINMGKMLEKQTNISYTELKNKEDEEKLGFHLSIRIISSEGELWEGRKRERSLIFKKLFW
jgi:hypothetical protein